MKYGVAVVSLVSVSSCAMALVIDPFTDAQSVSRAAEGTTLETVNGAMVGGSRRMGVTLFPGIPNVPISVTSRVLDGYQDYASGSFSASAMSLRYGRNGTAGNLNLDWSGLNRFTLRFLYNDRANTDVTIRVESNGGLNSSELTKSVGELRNPSQLVTWAFGDFVGNAAFNDVDSVRILFEPQEAGDFLVSEFQVVPEPTTMTSIALGGIWIAFRRRRKRSS